MSRVPDLTIDVGVRQRLTLRFGEAIESWFDELPALLNTLAEQWDLTLDSTIPRGSVSVVIRCRVESTLPAVLKVSPDRTRLAREAAALGTWQTVHTPSVLAVDESVGALLMEAINPGTALVESAAYPTLDSIAELLTALHATRVPDRSYPSLAHRVAYLFDSGAKLYHRNSALADLVPREVYERGRQLALRLAEERAPMVLLHGDFTPSNILNGGERRGLVAIDPAPCTGDSAFDAVDLLCWQADDTDVVTARAERLAPAVGLTAGRLLDWCTAFAGMTALDIADSSGHSRARIQSFVALATGDVIDR
jgi:streptomycin 6-kinase